MVAPRTSAHFAGADLTGCAWAVKGAQRRSEPLTVNGKDKLRAMPGGVCVSGRPRVLPSGERLCVRLDKVQNLRQGMHFHATREKCHANQKA